MKRYTTLADAEKINLTNDEFADAVKLEAIHTGIRPPVALSEALRNSEWRGYQPPRSGVRVWVLDTRNNYGDKLGYLDPELARKALVGAVILGDTYRAGKSVQAIKYSEVPAVQEVLLMDPAANASLTIPEFPDSPDSEKFDDLVEKCREDWEKVCTEHYNAKARAERWQEYLRLAYGDVDTACRFWEHANEGPLPTEAIQPPGSSQD